MVNIVFLIYLWYNTVRKGEIVMLDKKEIKEVLDEYGIKMVDLPNFQTKEDVRRFCELFKAAFLEEFEEKIN